MRLNPDFASPGWLRLYGFKTDREQDTYYQLLSKQRARGLSNYIGEATGTDMVNWARQAGHEISLRTGRRWLERWRKKRLIVEGEPSKWRFNRTVYAVATKSIPKH